MFTWLNKQGVQSDRGFIVQRTGRFTAEYRDGNRVVTLDVEDGFDAGMTCMLLDPDAFLRWDDGTAIAVDQQKQLFDNVNEAMAFQGLKMIVEKGESPFS